MRYTNTRLLLLLQDNAGQLVPGSPTVITVSLVVHY